MASLERRNRNYRVVFRFAGQKFSRSLRTKHDTVANACLARLEDNLRRLELGTLTLPEGADVASFLLSDGQRNGRPRQPRVDTLADVCERYLAAIPENSIEQTTFDGMRTHIRHLERLLGSSFRFHTITLGDLQRYIDQRAQEEGLRGKNVSAATIKKEIVTLNAIWCWARTAGYVDRLLPKTGLRYPKTTEKPPFQTWEEIERTIARGRLSPHEQADLWGSLFLTLPEIDEFLQYVEEHARHPFVHPMFVFAAHTGARRSEMLRSRLEDVDLVANTVVIREKKRIRGKLTTRKVPLSGMLSKTLKAWLGRHPGGQHTFCHELRVVRSRTTRSAFGPLSRDEAHDHFKRTLVDSKWVRLHGWHVFRHSFCSNCAARGVDQRIINGWVGHQTEEMVRRYRHLIPNQQQEAIKIVFRT